MGNSRSRSSSVSSTDPDPVAVTTIGHKRKSRMLPFPPEVLETALSLLNTQELKTCRLVNRTWNENVSQHLVKRNRSLSWNAKDRRLVRKDGGPLMGANYPRYWDPMPPLQPGRTFVTFDVKWRSEEWINITKLVSSDVNLNYHVHSAKRIQNPSTFQSYMKVKAEMETAFGASNVKEEWAFHGTKEPRIDSICEKNFDLTLANYGPQGTGVYFSSPTNANTSMGYCSVDYTNSSRPRKLLLCKILVGQTTRRHSHYEAPPRLVTIVDNLVFPMIYVCPTPHSFQPEYILEMTQGRSGYA